MAYGRVNVGIQKEGLPLALTTKYNLTLSYGIGEITSIGMNDNFLAIGTVIGTVYLYDISKSEKTNYTKLDFGTSSRTNGVAISKNNFICCGNKSGYYAIKDLSNPTQTKPSSRAPQVINVISSSRYNEETFIIAYEDGHIRCVDEANNILWSKETNDKIYRVSKTEDGNLTVLNSQREIVCYDKNNGSEKWRTKDLEAEIFSMDAFKEEGVIACSKEFIFHITKEGLYNKYATYGNSFTGFAMKKDKYFFGLSALDSSERFPIKVVSPTFKVVNDFGIGVKDAIPAVKMADSSNMMAVSWVIAPSILRGITVYYKNAYE